MSWLTYTWGPEVRSICLKKDAIKWHLDHDPPQVVGAKVAGVIDQVGEAQVQIAELPQPLLCLPPALCEAVTMDQVVPWYKL